MKRAIDETTRRRELQEEYNREHGIMPQTIIKSIEATLVTASEADYFKVPLELEDIEDYSPQQIDETIARLDFEMREHAKKFEFEKAAELRDRIKYLRERELAVAWDCCHRGHRCRNPTVNARIQLRAVTSSSLGLIVRRVLCVLCGKSMLVKTQPDEIQNYLSDASYLTAAMLNACLSGNCRAKSLRFSPKQRGRKRRSQSRAPARAPSAAEFPSAESSSPPTD